MSKIKITKKEVTSETTYWNIEGTINDKNFIATKWLSTDSNIGITDSGIEFIDSDLTEKEKEELEQYLGANE